MPTFAGTPVPINRFLGQVDQDDPTNMPVGCAALCRNSDFTRDSPGVTSVGVRAGNNKIMQGINKAAITGFLDFQYQAETATDVSFQMPLLFDLDGALQREYPVGSGAMRAVPAGMFTPPAASHMLAVQAGNKMWSAWSNLLKPTAGASCFDPKTLNVDPLGMKPYGWRWLPATYVYAGEVCTPSNQSAGLTGNGHTYQAQNSGTTGAIEPAWPGEGGAIGDGPVLSGVIWKEITMVMANRLPAPLAPALALSPGTGTFASGRTVWILMTLVNGMGETVGGATASITTTAASQGVLVTIPALGPAMASPGGWLTQLAAPYAVTAVNVYEADVASGAPAPAQSSYQLSGIFTPGIVGFVPGPASSGTHVPTLNTARITPGQLPTPDTEAELTRNPGAGAFPAGRDVWVRLSYSNNNGETPLGPSNSVVNTLANDAVLVTLAAVAEFPQLSVINVYEADVPTGNPEPPVSAYARVGSYSVNGTPTITATATGQAPVTANGTGPGGNIVSDTADGGINATQGYRYATPMWMNRNETVSGFTEAAVQKYIVDEDGWELAVFNVPLGPPNIIGRPIAFSVADGTQAGPFFWIGIVDLEAPTQNYVYPQQTISDGIAITATMLLDNVTTTATFNFTDEYLEASNSVTDRLRVTAPPSCKRIDFLKSANRLCLAGVPGYKSGLWISLGADYESFYGDTSPVPIMNNGSEECWGVADYGGVLYAMCERSGYTISPGQGDPASWSVLQRWGQEDGGGVGACGPRAFAACSDFLIFVHRSGIYKYESTKPDLMSKEIPREWGRINWLAAQTICISIDQDTHTVRVQVPVGDSLVPNEEICLSYLEGWLNPIHFSSYGQKEITQEASRRFVFNDVSAFICRRISRTVPNAPEFLNGPDGTTQLGSDWYVSQLIYCSSMADGVVNARTPGLYQDNDAGIDWQYETMAAGAMQKTCKIEGVNLNMRGNTVGGPISVSFLAGRDMVTDSEDPGGPKTRELMCAPVDVTPNQHAGITRKVPRRINEYWRLRFTNGRQKGVWCAIKQATVYVLPVKAGRSEFEG